MLLYIKKYIKTLIKLIKIFVKIVIALFNIYIHELLVTFMTIKFNVIRIVIDCLIKIKTLKYNILLKLLNLFAIAIALELTNIKLIRYLTNLQKYYVRYFRPWISTGLLRVKFDLEKDIHLLKLKAMDKLCENLTTSKNLSDK